MIVTAILLALTALLVIIPLTIYGRRDKRLMRFYLRMSYSYTCRRFYQLLTLLLLLILHALYSFAPQTQVSTLDLLPSSALFLCLFSYRFAERIFHFMQHRRTFFLCGIITLVCAFTPHFLPTAITLAVIMQASAFFPSHRAIEAIQFPDSRKQVCANPDLLYNYYFDLPVADTSKKSIEDMQRMLDSGEESVQELLLTEKEFEAAFRDTFNLNRYT